MICWLMCYHKGKNTPQLLKKFKWNTLPNGLVVLSYPKGHSLVAHSEIWKHQQRKVAVSAPAMSVRSKTSKTVQAINLIEMELNEMKE
jgi:hypothetical protein